ncbi:MAG: coproporphyrinogen III oxidase [Alphaproteobacteria bacterium]|nr:coproporphyrinogen III oxidase [Alphaproteobacteria bacterium]
MNNSSLYIHFPICKAKCPYCDFNSHVMNFSNISQWQKAYENELKFYANLIGPRKITSIFFGGGTPSLMPIALVESILNNISKYFEVKENIEISLEANPTSSEAQKFKALKEAGINRLSLGIQALNNNDLKFLGREHCKEEAIKAILLAKDNFTNFSFDLIYARPGQTMDAWAKELDFALALSPKHLSLYQLTIEKGTKFYKQHSLGEFTLPAEAEQIKLYDLTEEKCAKYSLKKYEISNYAKDKFESQHNLNYWQYGDYIGIGAGAHSRITIDRIKHSFLTYHQPEKWLKHSLELNNSIQKQTKLSKEAMLEELLIFGLRIKNGINLKLFDDYLGKSFNAIYGDKLNTLCQENLIKITKQKLIATSKGQNLAHNITNFMVKNASL